MAKLDFVALAKKYKIGPGEATGKKYRALMKAVTAHETENVAQGIVGKSNSAYKRQLANLGEQYQDIIRFPGFQDVMPKRGIYLRKAAQDGDMISNTLRDKLTNKLRAALSEKDKSGRLKFIGPDGRVSPKAVKRLRSEMAGVYKWYTGRRGKKGELPSNLEAIATTEIRSAADAAKAKYNELFAEHNSDIGRMTKTWRQNRSLSHEPRPAHTYVHGRTVKMSELFNVPIMVKRKGRWIRKGWEKMAHPHAAGASPESTINCHCDVDYTFTLKKIKPKGKIPKQPTGEIMPKKPLQEIKPKRPLEEIKPKLIQLSKTCLTMLENKLAVVKAYPVGHISTRKDGTKWKKIARIIS